MGSQLGIGSRFNVDKAGTPGSHGASVHSSSADQHGWRGAGRVLLVEDALSVAKVTGMLLADHGFEVELLSKGAEAVEKIVAQPKAYRFVLLDMSLPDLSGAEVLRRVRDRGAKVPVVLTSGYPKLDIAPALDSKDYAGFLQKPYRLETFVEQLQAALSAG